MSCSELINFPPDFLNTYAKAQFVISTDILPATYVHVTVRMSLIQIVHTANRKMKKYTRKVARHFLILPMFNSGYTNPEVLIAKNTKSNQG